LTQFVLQRLAMHAKNFRSAGDIPLGVLKATRYIATLKLAPIFTKVCRKWYRQTIPAGLWPFAFRPL
jgi:hypothetical protein